MRGTSRAKTASVYPDLCLLPKHEQLFVDSAISPAVAQSRGYRSVEKKAALKDLGFSNTQCRVPALLLPVWSVHGQIVNYQIRPDTPRIDKDGRVVKYE